MAPNSSYDNYHFWGFWSVFIKCEFDLGVYHCHRLIIQTNNQRLDCTVQTLRPFDGFEGKVEVEYLKDKKSEKSVLLFNCYFKEEKFNLGSQKQEIKVKILITGCSIYGLQ